MYKTIVVGYDDSEFSKAALTESSKWIKRHGGTAVFVHAVFFNEEEFASLPEQREKRFELGKKMCLQAKRSAAAEFGLNGELETLLCEGEPYEVIVDVANAKHADLIAIGTHGRKGLKKMFMGSVTSRVLQSSPCDVLVVKNPGQNPDGYKSILLSYDGSSFSKNAMGRACMLAKNDGAEITALYVIPRYEEMVEFFSSSVIRENLIRDARKVMDGALEIASEHGCNLKCEITDGPESEKIAEIARNLKSDLIIRGTHGWSGFNKAIIGSVIENVIVNAPCPVLAVR